MSTQEETLYKGTSNVQVGKPVNGEKKDKTNWAVVSVAGVAALAIGGGAAYAASQLSQDHSTDGKTEGPAHQTGAHEQAADHASVSEDLSFSEAFTAARAQVGPGGVFTWHGQLYGTYTQTEWNAMSDQEKADFAQAAATQSATHSQDVHVQPVAATQHVVVEHVHHVVNDDQHDVHAHHTTSTHDTPTPTPTTHHTPTPTPTTHHTPTSTPIADPVAEDNDIHVVGRGEIQGHYAVLYDTDHDEEGDVAVVDINDNHRWDEEDVVISRGGEMVTIGDLGQHQGGGDGMGTNTECAAESNTMAEDPNMHMASNDNPDVAPDMPDYMNDADVTGDFYTV